MKTKLTYYGIWLCTIMALAVVIGNGCTSAQIQKQEQIELAIQPLVDVGLTVTGLGSITPLNDAGVKALTALQTDYANKTGISLADAQSVTDAATLGLKLTGDAKAAAYVTTLAPTFNQAVTTIIAAPVTPAK